jgi:hypothetical protein
MTDTPFSLSYIPTDAELETLIGNDPRTAAVALKALAAASQEWYCQEATRHIDALPLRGTRYEEQYIENGVQKDADEDGLAQVLEFPRVIDGVTKDWDYGTDLPIVPALVKRACLEEAIAIYQAGAGGGLKDLQEQGVSAMSIGGKLSYTFVGGGGSSPLLSAAAKRIMRRYVGAVIR